MKDEQLLEVGLADERWADYARQVISGERTISEAVEEEANGLRYFALNGLLSIADLRQGLMWANNFDREAVEQYGADLNQGKQQEERTARRIMHLATREALDSLKTTTRRTVAQVTLKGLAMPHGMGRLETHDMRDKDLVQ